MELLVKETLKKHLQLLSARSEKAVDGELNSYTEQIINLAKLLDGETILRGDD
ncbi:MAG: hypothetical protein IKN16_02225 [Selenomonadaceae bacterium]|nr:hypothetical protein [Selenomonadaceae bacterium]